MSSQHSIADCAQTKETEETRMLILFQQYNKMVVGSYHFIIKDGFLLTMLFLVLKFLKVFLCKVLNE